MCVHVPSHYTLSNLRTDWVAICMSQKQVQKRARALERELVALSVHPSAAKLFSVQLLC